MKKYLWLFLLSITLQQAWGQCNLQNKAFADGEYVTYDVVYNWGFIWVDAGKADFAVHDTTYQNQPAWYFLSTGTSLSRWDWMYKVRDKYEAIVQKETLNPLWFSRKTSEGGYKVDNQYWFHPTEKSLKSSTQNSKTDLEVKTISYEGCLNTVLSMIYQARNIDYDQYNSGDKIPIQLILDGTVYPLYLRYLGKEDFEMRDGRVFHCIKFTPKLVEGTMFEGGEDMTVYVSDDANKIPIMVEAKILVGSVKAYLTKAEHLRQPMLQPIHH